MVVKVLIVRMVETESEVEQVGRLVRILSLGRNPEIHYPKKWNWEYAALLQYFIIWQKKKANMDIYLY